MSEIRHLTLSGDGNAPLQAAVAPPGYELGPRIGVGAFGEVFAGRQLASGQAVAMKFVRRGSLDELGKLVKVGEHPYVVPLLDAELNRQPPCLVMPLLASSLGSLKPPLDPATAARWLEQVAEALRFIHARGLIHCDLKPDNILLDEQGAARLTDFGQSRTRGETSRFGTLFFMPPEQVTAALNQDFAPETTWDFYALGATFYWALTGRVPRYLELPSGTQILDMLWLYRRRLKQERLVPLRSLNPEVDVRLALIIERCLELSPARRYKNASDLVEDLALRAAQPSNLVDSLALAWRGWRFRFQRPRPPRPWKAHLARAPLALTEGGTLWATGRAAQPGLSRLAAFLPDLPQSGVRHGVGWGYFSARGERWLGCLLPGPGPAVGLILARELLDVSAEEPFSLDGFLGGRATVVLIPGLPACVVDEEGARWCGTARVPADRRLLSCATTPRFVRWVTPDGVEAQAGFEGPYLAAVVVA